MFLPYLARLPRSESRPDADYYVIEDVTPFPVGGEGAWISPRSEGKSLENPLMRHSDTRPGAMDGVTRLTEQDLDHIRAELIYPEAFGFYAYASPDGEFSRELLRVYHD